MKCYILVVSIGILLGGVTRAQDEKGFDINTLVGDFIEISKVINAEISALKTEITPPIQDIVSQMPANTQVFLNNILVPVDELLTTVIVKVDELNAQAEQAHIDLAPIDPCIMNQTSGISSGFDALFNTLLDCADSTFSNHSVWVGEMEVHFNNVLDLSAYIIEVHVPNMATCLMPGTVNAKPCFDTEFGTLVDTLNSLIWDLLYFGHHVAFTIMIGGSDIYKCSATAREEFVADYQVWGQYIADCIASV